MRLGLLHLFPVARQPPLLRLQLLQLGHQVLVLLDVHRRRMFVLRELGLQRGYIRPGQDYHVRYVTELLLDVGVVTFARHFISSMNRMWRPPPMSIQFALIAPVDIYVSLLVNSHINCHETSIFLTFPWGVLCRCFGHIDKIPLAVDLTWLNECLFCSSHHYTPHYAYDVHALSNSFLKQISNL